MAQLVQSPILVLADDLTGALEVGAKFAAVGTQAQVRATPCHARADFACGAGVLVVDTETRHLAAEEAARRVHELGRTAFLAGISTVYKKTDSTLRGNIAAELYALMAAYADSPLLYVPAYPPMGRTVRNGSLYVDGVLVGETCFARDALNPVKQSHIPSLLASAGGIRVRSVKPGEALTPELRTITVYDGETDEDVAAAAHAFINSSMFKLAAGPSAFAAQLALHWDLPRSQPRPMPMARNALVVSGSLHKVSIQQVKQAKRDGFRSITEILAYNDKDDAGWTILDQESAGLSVGREFGRRLAANVCGLLTRHGIDLLVVFGGDTAYGIVEAIGNPRLYPLGEVIEGIPISRVAGSDLCGVLGRDRRDLYLVTKAGGFGPPGVLAQIRTALSER